MNVFITGGLTGLGYQTAQELNQLGYKVAVCSVEESSIASKTLPSNIDYFQADVTNPKAIKDAIESFQKKAGSIDIIYANAGINHPKEAIPDWELCRKVVDVNINGVINTVAPAIDIMKSQNKGHIVFIASVSAFGGLPGMSVYGSTKAFIKNFSESLAIDLKPFNIDITLLAPGFIHTPLTKKNDHKMPFLMSQEEGGKQIVKAILGKKKIHVFPMPMKLLSSFISHLPRGIFRSIMSSDLFGFKRS